MKGEIPREVSRSSSARQGPVPIDVSIITRVHPSRIGSTLAALTRLNSRWRGRLVEWRERWAARVKIPKADDIVHSDSFEASVKAYTKDKNPP